MTTSVKLLQICDANLSAFWMGDSHGDNVGSSE